MGRAWLPLLLAAAWALRVALVLQGGQVFFQDEMRYFRSARLLNQLAWYGDVGWALDELLNKPEHIGFAWLGVVPELFRFAAARLLRLPDAAAVSDTLLWIPALVLSLASVGCIGLLYPIARRAGAERGEALLAAVLLACSTSLLYWSRHLMPYDTALFLALLGLWVGLERRTVLWRSGLVGALAGLAFLTYNGYWITALIVLALHLAVGQLAVPAMIRRVAATLAGLALFPALLTFAAQLRDARPFYQALSGFAGTVTQGEYAEGWSFPWEYLWQAEHGLLLAWAAGAALAVWALLRERRPLVPASRGLLWLGATLGIYLLLAVGSTGLHTFVVYGRLARQLVPFLCLLTAYGVATLAGSRPIPKRARQLTAVALVMQVAFNFAGPFTQRFPGELERQVAATYGPVTREVTIAGCCWQWESDEIHRPPGSTAYGAHRYVLLDTTYLFPVRGAKDPPPGTVILRVPHPFAYLPYQYESFGPVERAILRRTDISMRLIDTQALASGSQQPEARAPTGDGVAASAP